MKYWCNIFITSVLILLTACVERQVYHGNTVVRTDNPVNKEVGHQLGELARDRAHEFLCLAPDSYNIIIIEVHKTKNRIPSYKKAVVLPWIFIKEKFIDDQSNSFDEKIAYYTRNNGPNSPIPHELGHDLWDKYIIGKAKKFKRKGNYYGTIAPDWLDEAVAILFESDADKMSRRVQFFDSLSQGYTYDIEQLFKAKHPIWVSQQSGNQIAMETPQLSPNTNNLFAYDENILFYLQSLMIAEYLIESSDNSCILTEIGKRISEKGTFLQWLSEQNTLTNVHNLSTLEDGFHQWVKEKSLLHPPLEEWILREIKQNPITKTQ